ncbi:iduronate sulfatase [Flammeovirga pectinis]|uniref:Iduronate sulfatase n=1 Tax=Flammeovirga pectinis TaxID=2494373 RepID=A0A3S9P9A8_9BACT|nr:sulfatase [Flammeovirga pectinis]AZQ64801.1 iduronate sulfatase [Flammeovirga pectinis]
MRYTYNILLTAFLTLTIFSSGFCQEKSDKRPNILFIAIDDMNDWTGFLGGHEQTITPNMDKLADQGINFTNAHCSAPGCSPSRNSLLYGIEPFNSGLYPFYEHDIHATLMKEYTSLPRLLKENGYDTFGAGKIHHGNLNDEREWTHYDETKGGKQIFVEGEGYQKGKSKKMSFRPTHHADEDHKDHQVASYGIDVLNEKHDKPFFLAVGIVKPHLPFDAPKRFFDALPENIQAPAIYEEDLMDIPKEGLGMRKAGDYNFFKKEGKWEDVRRAYLACISWADFNIGRVLEALENSEYADNTIVVLWSDHGYHLGEKMSFKKFTLWEEATKVPFIIYDPRKDSKVKGGENYDEAVSLINIYKTIADFAVIETPKYVDGESLVPVLKHPNKTLKHPAITSWGKGNYAVRTEDYRYIRYYDGTEELYFHTEDDNEWYNLAKGEEYQEKKEELASYLPQNEAPLVKDFVAPWSVEGEGREEFRGTEVKKKKKASMK